MRGSEAWAATKRKTEADRFALDPYHHPAPGSGRKPGTFPRPIDSIPVAPAPDADDEGGDEGGPEVQGRTASTKPDVSGTVSEVLERYQGASPEELQAVIEAEIDGQARTTLVDALTARLAE